MENNEMTEREMLELAAKAAGIKIDYSDANGGGQFNNGFDLLGNAVLNWHNGKTWNPLTDDGDIMRLAGALNLNIEICEKSIDVWFCICKAIVHIDEPVAGDKMAAIRLAITKAAAEIGRCRS